MEPRLLIIGVEQDTAVQHTLVYDIAGHALGDLATDADEADCFASTVAGTSEVLRLFRNPALHALGRITHGAVPYLRAVNACSSDCGSNACVCVGDAAGAGVDAGAGAAGGAAGSSIATSASGASSHAPLPLLYV